MKITIHLRCTYYVVQTLAAETIQNIQIYSVNKSHYDHKHRPCTRKRQRRRCKESNPILRFFFLWCPCFCYCKEQNKKSVKCRSRCPHNKQTKHTHCKQYLDKESPNPAVKLLPEQNTQQINEDTEHKMEPTTNLKVFPLKQTRSKDIM